MRLDGGLLGGDTEVIGDALADGLLADIPELGDLPLESVRSQEWVLVKVLLDPPLQAIANLPVVTSRTRILGAGSGPGDVVVVTSGPSDVPGPGGLRGPPSDSEGAGWDLELPGDITRRVPFLQHCESSNFDRVTPLRSSSLCWWHG